jgi:hypothetical protein
MIIAVDSGVRIANCFSYSSHKIERVAVAVTGVVTDRGAVDLLEYTPTTPETRDTEIEMARLYASEADVCIFDGLPTQICRKNIGIIKTGRTVEGWICVAHGPYAVCADFDPADMVRKAIEMNTVVHRIVHKRAKILFEYELVRRKCVTAVGIHVIPELSYYNK